MKLRVLTAEQLERFDNDGFVVLRGVFSPVEVARMRRAFDRLEARAAGLDETQLVEGSQFVVDHDCGFVRIHRVVWCGAAEPDLLAFGEDPRLLGVAADVLGTVEFDQLINQAHFKLPGDEVFFAWHQDSRHRRYGTELWTDLGGHGGFLETATAIDAMTVDNGPLRFIPGSHALGHIATVGDTKQLPEGTFDATDAVTVLLDPGDVAIFGPYVVHGSDANRSDVGRRLFLNGYAVPGANRRVYPGVGAGRRVVLPSD